MRNSMKCLGLAILGLGVGWIGSRAAVIVADHDNPGGLPAMIAAEAAAVPATPTTNYAFVALPTVGNPLQVTEDGTAILITYNGGNVYAYRWRQGVTTELSCIRPAGTRIKLHAANRNGMVVVVFELPTRAYFVFEGGLTKQVVVAWMPDSTTPVFLNVPIAEATTWGVVATMRSVDFKFLDDQNRIWGETYHVVQGPDGTLIYPELARWDTPSAAATFIGHKKNVLPSVQLLGVSSGTGEPFGHYSPPETGSSAYPFAGSFSNRLNYTPASMNSQGWVLGKRGFTPVLSRDGIEYPLPANNAIALIDEENNLYNSNRTTVWTTDPKTFVSTPTSSQNSYVAVPMHSIALPEGYSTGFRPVKPGDTALQLGNMIHAGNAVPAIFVPAEIRPDANRDGVITLSRMPDDPDRLLAEKKLPWYFWVNDDDDAGETDGNDIPGAGSNGRDSAVNGVRDLVDFFPLHLNIARLLSLLPPTTPGISYQLAQVHGAANFLTTDLSPEDAGKYHSNADIARTLGGSPVTRITPEGTPLDAALIAQASTQGKGVILVEAREPTTKPLQLEVRRGTELLARLDLPLSFAGVEDMFRHRNLVKAVNQRAITLDRNSTTNWPDSLNNKQAFVFVHGYNVNQKQARGWQAEFFKRLWWSGSNAQFWGVTWYGSDSQKRIGSHHFSPNYHVNVVHAFGCAPKLAEFITTLRGTDEAPMIVNVAGHSLGNMVVSSAISDHKAPVTRYFMIDAAVAAEAYDGTIDSQVADASTTLPHTEWNKEFEGVYNSRLWAANWHLLFDEFTNDGRATLTWRNRFRPINGVAYYGFYSTGEEVLDYDGATTPSVVGILTSIAINKLSEFLHVSLPGSTGQPVGHKTWQYQEQLKGRNLTNKFGGSNYGGWGFNIFDFAKRAGGYGKGPELIPAVLRPDEANNFLETVFTEEALREEPFFRPGDPWVKVGTWTHPSGKPDFKTGRLGALYGATTGSTFASTHRDTLLARMIPAISPPAGRIAVPILGLPNLRNFNMDDETIRPKKVGSDKPPWPNIRTTTDWWHSDLRDVAYPYVRGLYFEIVKAGALNGYSL
jgi:hypothetical protein